MFVNCIFVVILSLMNLNRLNAQEDGHWLLLWTNELQCP